MQPITTSQETGLVKRQPLSGETAKENTMKSVTNTVAKTDSNVLSIAFVALLGFIVLFGAGFASSGVIHDSAHDTRHITGFACH